MSWNISKLSAQKQGPRAESAPCVAFFLAYDTGNKIQPTAADCRVGKMVLKHPNWALFQNQPIKNGKKQAPMGYS